MWVTFNRDFDWKPTAQVTITYRAGRQENVTRAAGEAAIAAGAAEEAKAPARKAKASEDGAES
jgi:hypothetical protein